MARRLLPAGLVILVIAGCGGTGAGSPAVTPSPRSKPAETTGRPPDDAGAIEALCAQAIAASPKAVAEYKAGKAQAINAIKGQVMKLSQGKANPSVVGEILARLLA